MRGSGGESPRSRPKASTRIKVAEKSFKSEEKLESAENHLVAEKSFKASENTDILNIPPPPSGGTPERIASEGKLV